MPNTSHCTRCGAVLASFGADALCPKCMVGEAVGLAANAADGDEGTHVVAAPTEGIGTRIGPYKLLQPLGQGGMGTFWLAEQTEPVRRKVALKLSSPAWTRATCWRASRLG